MNSKGTDFKQQDFEVAICTGSLSACVGCHTGIHNSAATAVAVLYRPSILQLPHLRTFLSVHALSEISCLCKGHLPHCRPESHGGLHDSELTPSRL